MWGIALTNAAGDIIDEVEFRGPVEAIREACRASLASGPEASQARLVSPDGLLDYAYPERSFD